MGKPKVVAAQPAARRSGRNYIFGVAFTLEKEINGVPVRTTVMAPAVIRPRDRSKYDPKQCFKQGKR